LLVDQAKEGAVRLLERQKNLLPGVKHATKVRKHSLVLNVVSLYITYGKAPAHIKDLDLGF
jgi:hypothetical protein